MSRIGAVRAACVALLLWVAWAAAAQVAVPPLTGRVVDQTGTLTAEQVARIDATLAELEARKGSQIAVLLVPTTQPETVEQFALRVAEAWKIGRKGIDDGALLVVAKDDRVLRIEVGYGLEGALNDATAKRIIEEVIVPQFRAGRFAEGITAGVDRMVRVIDGEPLPAPRRQAQDVEGLEQIVPLVLVLMLAFGGVFRALLGRFAGGLATGAGVGLVTWLFIGVIPIALLAGVVAFVFTLTAGGVNMSGGRGGGFGGGFGGRSSGGWGGSGGGFSGGGGSFGGGGASGRW